MRIEIIFLIIVSGICYHIYTDGKWTLQFIKYKKQLQIAGIIVVSLILYWLFKKDPIRAQKLILSGNEYIKYLPIDETSSNIITPIIDFTKKWTNLSSFDNKIIGGGNREQSSITKMTNSGSNTSKRSVSESKKKFVAAQQGWVCYDCGKQLNSTYEVDHIVPLHKNGTNHIDNLNALCPECHRKRTIQTKL
jgi:hypothetical protein